jgi:diguanylate cyclase (GGDEF)-like protein
MDAKVQNKAAMTTANDPLTVSLPGHLPDSEFRHVFSRTPWGTAILEAVDDGRDFVLIDINSAGAAVLRLERDSLLGMRLSNLLPVSARLGLLDKAARTWATGRSERGPDNQDAHPDAQTLGIYQMQRLPSGRVALSFDGEAMRVSQQARIHELAYIDALTRLPNRRLLLDRLQQSMANSQRSGQHGGLIFIDLDNFKMLNDTRGHDVGDRLLTEVANRLQASVREADTVARFGGDEFVVLLENLNARKDRAAKECEDVARKILVNLKHPYALSGQEFWSSASLGLTVFEGKRRSADELLKHADIAMYQAKADGRNGFCYFDPAMQESVNAQARMEAELRAALEHHEFGLRFQPEVDSGGHLVGVEAFICWRQANQTTHNAAEFIPLAEETGLIHQIGQLALNMACRQLAEWQDSPTLAGVPLSVNISAKQFRQPHFVAQVRAALADSGADPALLRLELTEGLIFENLPDTREKMLALQAIGVRFALGNFGTGYLSLAEFKHLALDQVKIDRSFVRNFLQDPGDAAVARSVIAMGEMFGIPVIAEGVETGAQRDFLVSQGCASLQGNLFGEPVPPEDFIRRYG